jgi:dethiobiotin synthetase
MNGVIITGTDTGVGKTVVCRCLAVYLQSLGLNVITQKWVQTGCESSDDVQLHSITPLITTFPANKLAELRVPYRLKYPASPHLAAALEGDQIDTAKLEAAYAELAKHFEMVIVEGSGGVLVPIAETIVLADVAAHLSLPTVVVVGNKLGCINHTLLTIEALRSRGLRIVGLVFNRVESACDETIFTDNVRITGLLGGVPVLGELPYLAEPEDAADLFRPIGEAFYRKWRNADDE